MSGLEINFKDDKLKILWGNLTATKLNRLSIKVIGSNNVFIPCTLENELLLALFLFLGTPFYCSYEQHL